MRGDVNQLWGVLAGVVTVGVLLVGCAADPDEAGAPTPSPVPASVWSGVWGEPDTEGKPYLELGVDQSVAGSDGCNRLMGQWRPDGDTVSFGQLASSMMFCEGVDTWLSGAATATLSGSTMTVRNVAGDEIGTLTRAD